MNDSQEYVKISTSTEGDALVEVFSTNPGGAMALYQTTIELLTGYKYLVANDKANEIKASNDNTKFMPTVTVKGRGTEVVDMFITELTRMSNK